jgi:hypothetical protein
MAAKTTVPAWRRAGASLAMGATAAGLGVAMVRSPFLSWYDALPAAVMALAAVGLSRRGLVTQALSRGTAWIVLVPTLAVTVVGLVTSHRFEHEAALMAAGTVLALVLGRPMLHTDEARAAFSPVRFRRWFLASMTATAATFLTVGAFALDAARGTHVGAAMGLGALGLSLLASLVGITRMRGWAPLLATVTSLATLVAALVTGGPAGVALALAALPGLLMAAPLLLSRLIPAPASAPDPVATRIGLDDCEPAARVRIAPIADAEGFPSVDPSCEPARALARRG